MISNLPRPSALRHLMNSNASSVDGLALMSRETHLAMEKWTTTCHGWLYIIWIYDMYLNESESHWLLLARFCLNKILGGLWTSCPFWAQSLSTMVEAWQLPTDPLLWSMRRRDTEKRCRDGCKERGCSVQAKAVLPTSSNFQVFDFGGEFLDLLATLLFKALVSGSTASILMFPMDLVKRQMQMVGLLCSMSLVVGALVEDHDVKIVKLIQRETSVSSNKRMLGGRLLLVWIHIMGRYRDVFLFCCFSELDRTDRDG